MFENPFAGLSVLAAIVSILLTPIGVETGGLLFLLGLALGVIGWLASKAGRLPRDEVALLGIGLSVVAALLYFM